MVVSQLPVQSPESIADVVVPDRDYFACAEDEIAAISSVLTIVGGKVVHGAGGFAALDETARLGRRKCFIERWSHGCTPTWQEHLVATMNR